MDDDIVIRCIHTVVQKSCITAAVLIKFLFKRLLDVFGLISNFLVVVTVFRIPGLIAAYSDVSFGTKEFAMRWRFGGLLQLSILLMDIPFAAMFICECIFTWRAVMMFKSYKKNNHSNFYYSDWGFEGWTIRIEVSYHFFLLILDILSLPMVIMVLCSWKCKLFYEQVIIKGTKGKDDLWRKSATVLYWCLLVLDIFTLILTIPLLFTWRAPLVWRAIINLYKAVPKDWMVDDIPVSKPEFKFRWAILSNSGRLIIDILMTPFVLALFFSWRLPILIKKIYQCLTGEGKFYKREVKLRKSIAHHCFRLLIDIIMIPFILVLLVSWRSFIVIKKIQKFAVSNRKKDNEKDLRFSIMFQFSQLLFDVCTLPAVILTCFSWRLFNLCCLPKYSYSWENKTFNRKFKKIRIQFWKEAAFLFMDIPCILALIIIAVFSFIFPWRFYKVVKGWELAKKENLGYVKDPSSGFPWYSEYYQRHLRSVTLKQLAFLIVDIPVVLMAITVVVTMWRLPHLIRRLYTEKPKERFSRMWYFITKEFALLFVDFFMALFMLIIFITLWRIIPMYRKIRKHTLPEKVQEEVQEEVITEEKVKLQEVQETEPAEEGKEDEINAEVMEGESSIPLTELPPHIGIPDCEIKTEIKAPPTFWDNFFGVRGWKIRKAVCLNLFGLMIDIPGLVLLLINVASIYQIPLFIERFMSAGDFYAEFFYIMIEETFNLLKDLGCLLLLILLIIVRPIAVWTNFLEDKKHMKMKKTKEHLRILKHTMRNERKSVMEEIESNISVYIKCHQEFAAFTLSEDFIKVQLCNSVLEYTSKLETIRDRLVSRDLDDKAIFYVSKIIFYENKRAHYYYRKFILETNYIKEPNASLRRNELAVFEKEMYEYEKIVSELYSALEDLDIKTVPLWTDATGFSERTRKETQIVLIHTLTSGYFGTIMLMLLNMLFIYRAPLMFSQMWQVRYSKDLVRNVSLETLKEYLLDILTLLKILIVILSIYRLPALVSDLTVDIIHKRSITSVRETVAKYPINVLRDIIDLLNSILRWKTIAYIFSSALFLIFMPFSIIATVGTAACSSPILGNILALPVYLILISGPFILTHYLAYVLTKQEDYSEHSISLFISIYFLLMTFILVLFVIIKSKAKGKHSTRVKPLDYVRLNWFNAQVWILEGLELIQLLALVFSIRNLGFTNSSTLRTIAQYILLDVYDYRIKYGISVALFFIWFFVCSVPIVLEKILEYVPVGTFTKQHFTWRAYLTFFGSTLFITGPELNLSFLACDYQNCTNTTVCPSLFDAPELPCWVGAHAAYASTSFFMLMWYLFTSLLYCLDYTDVENKKVDLNFSPPYSALVNIIKLIFIFIITLFTEEKLYILGAALFLLTMLILISVLFQKITGLEVSNSKVLLIWRIEVFFIVLTITLGLFLVEVFEDNISNSFDNFGDFSDNLPWSHFVVGICTLSIILISIVISLLLSKRFYLVSDKIRSRKQFKKMSREIIELVKGNHGLIPLWKDLSTPYFRMLKVVRVAQTEDKYAPDPDPYDRDFELDQPSPPLYCEIVLDETDSSAPPPPSYDKVKHDPAVIDLNDGNDPYFLPSVKMYLTACGNWKDYDAKTFTTMRGYIATAAMINRTNLTDVECTGVQLLLLLEENLSYHSLSLDFVNHLQSWREEVKGSNWTGLEVCIKKLRNNIDFSFGAPKNLDSAKSAPKTAYLPSNEDDSYFPKYFELTDLTSLKMAMHIRETAKLMELLPSPWVELFLKLIPDSDKKIPLINKVTFTKEAEFGNIVNLKVELFEDVVLTIKDIDEFGFKAAVGAQIILYNPINIRRIRLDTQRINFDPPFPRGKKGMLSHSITSCSATMCDRKGWLLVAAGKSVQLKKVLESLSHLDWKMKND